MSRRLTGLFGLLILNGAYLAAFDSPSLLYVSNVLFHVVAGLICTFLLASYLYTQARPVAIWAGSAQWAGMAAAVSGIVLIYTGTSRPFRWLLEIHILVACTASLLLFVWLFRNRSYWRWLGTVIVVSCLLAVGAPLYRQAYPDPLHRIANPIPPPTSLEGETAGPDSPFFPSAARTDVGHTIPSEFFMKSESCGRVGCHPDIYDQWSSSAHHFSSFNNQWYRKSIEYMQDVKGTQASKWCAGCHDHAVFFNGMMETPVKDLIDRPEAHVGLACTSCHSIVSVGSRMGNGDFVIEYPPLHDLASSDNTFLQALHDLVVHLDPGPHRKTFLKPFMREQTAEYCSSCHKVHLDVPVNDYRWFRGFNEYDGWQSSGVSGQGARSFYYPEQPSKCVDCHMPLTPSTDKGNIDGKVHNHRFPGANTALPVVNQDEEQLRITTEFLQADQISVDIFALSAAEDESRDESHRIPGLDGLQVSSGFAEGDEMGFAVGRSTGYTQPRSVTAPIDRVQPTLRRGETVRLDVVVRTRNVGHFFPGGTVDAFDVWVELKAEDENGTLLFWSGYVPTDSEGRRGPVDEGAHFYRSFLLDGHGNPINKRNAWAARSVLYVRLIPPGAADTVHYRVTVPPDSGDQIRLTARVNYRKFSWWNTQWAFAGVRDPADVQPQIAAGYDDGKWIFSGNLENVSGKLKQIPEIPIVPMATHQVTLKVDDEGTAATESILHPEDLTRWNDYGIGLFLQGDLKAAEQMFLRVTQIDPDYVDGWVNLGRVAIREGRTEDAQRVLQQALDLDPQLARAHYFMGLTYKTQGQYDKALQHLQSTRRQYPTDRVVLNQIGRILFLKREFAQAVEVLHQVLAIDAEDLQAHYNLMLSHRGLGDLEAARHEQALYLRYKADESAQAITGDYRRANPKDNNERQAIHEHTSVPLEWIRLQPGSSGSAGPSRESGSTPTGATAP